MTLIKNLTRAAVLGVGLVLGSATQVDAKSPELNPSNTPTMGVGYKSPISSDRDLSVESYLNEINTSRKQFEFACTEFPLYRLFHEPFCSHALKGNK